MNNVFIRGMLLHKYTYDDRVTIVTCSRSTEKATENRQFVTFRDKDLMKKIEDIPAFTQVTVEARAYFSNDRENADQGQIRLHGTSIITTRDFIRKNFSERGINPFGLTLKDCVRFSFSGFVASIAVFNERSVNITIKIPSGNHYNYIPCVKFINPERESIDSIMANYHKGDRISVNGWVRQTTPTDEKGKKTYKNRYVITSFLQSDSEYDFSGIKETAEKTKVEAPIDIEAKVKTSATKEELKAPTETITKTEEEKADAQKLEEERKEWIRKKEEEAAKPSQQKETAPKPNPKQEPEQKPSPDPTTKSEEEAKEDKMRAMVRNIFNKG